MTVRNDCDSCVYTRAWWLYVWQRIAMLCDRLFLSTSTLNQVRSMFWCELCCCWSNLRLGIEPFDPRGSEEDSETVLARQLAAQTTEVVPTPPVSPPPENTLIDLSEFVDLNADSTATTSPPTSPVSPHNDTVVVPERRRSSTGRLEISFFFYIYYYESKTLNSIWNSETK